MRLLLFSTCFLLFLLSLSMASKIEDFTRGGRDSRSISSTQFFCPHVEQPTMHGLPPVFPSLHKLPQPHISSVRGIHWPYPIYHALLCWARAFFGLLCRFRLRPIDHPVATQRHDTSSLNLYYIIFAVTLLAPSTACRPGGSMCTFNAILTHRLWS